MNMFQIQSIEGWASRLGYVVEKNESGGYVWFKESEIKFTNCETIEELIDQILAEIKISFKRNDLEG